MGENQTTQERLLALIDRILSEAEQLDGDCPCSELDKVPGEDQTVCECLRNAMIPSLRIEDTRRSVRCLGTTARWLSGWPGFSALWKEAHSSQDDFNSWIESLMVDPEGLQRDERAHNVEQLIKVVSWLCQQIPVQVQKPHTWGI